MVTATARAATPYFIPLSAVNHISQACGSTGITAAQILAAPIIEIDFRSDSGTAAITASALTSNINTTVPTPGTYPATCGMSITVVGEVSFVP